eukprot:g73855.t1
MTIIHIIDVVVGKIGERVLVVRDILTRSTTSSPSQSSGKKRCVDLKTLAYWLKVRRRQRDLHQELDEDDCGVEAWKFYRKLLMNQQDRAEQQQARSSEQKQPSLPHRLAEPDDTLADIQPAGVPEQQDTRSVSPGNLRALSEDQPEDRPAGSGGLVVLTKENAHQGDILVLQKFYLPRPDWGRIRALHTSGTSRKTV